MKNKRNLIIGIVAVLTFSVFLLASCGPERSETVSLPVVTPELAATVEPTEPPASTAGVAVEPSTVPLPTATPEPTSAPTQTPEPTATNTATTEPTATLKPTQTPTPPYPEGDLVEVVHVVDGDTIDVEIDGIVYPVRYIGMDTPERGAVYFAESTQANADMVEGQTVVLVKDISETDRYNRLLRYVYLLDGTFVNAELVRLGFAQPATYPPDIAHQDEFVQLQQEARTSSAGLWGLPTNTPIPLPTWTPAPPTAVPQPTSPPAAPTAVPQPTSEPLPPTSEPPPPPPPEQNCSPYYPGVCIPPYPPDLNCGDISFRRFQVLQPDPHGFDRDKDGIGCESG